MRAMGRRSRGALAVAALGVLALLGAPAGAQEQCATCHEDVVKAFAKTGHGRIFSVDKAYASASCVSCHGTGDDHINSGGEARILNPAKATATEANASCLSCHDKNPAQAHWQGSPHQAAGVKCASCHDVHGEAGSTTAAKDRPGPASTTRKCLECHNRIRPSLHQRSAHPMREGQMDCRSCHNPHGTAGEKLIDQASLNDLCYSCHQQLRGPFLWEHSPVREDCLTCHKAHGSNYPSLLQARVTQLCQSCHQQGRHQTIAGLPTAFMVANKACLNCHPQVHGSNHPSGPLFQR